MENLKEQILIMEGLMNQEIDGIDGFLANQSEFKRSLVERDWSSLENELRLLEDRSEAMRELDGRRHQAWETLKFMLRPLEREDFIHVVNRLPLECRERIIKKHNELKVQVLRLQGVMKGLDAYLQTTTAVIRAALVEVQPGLKGKIYSKLGQVRAGESVSLFLNQQY